MPAAQFYKVQKMPNEGHRWSRCDDIMVLDLYIKAGHKQLPSSDDKVIDLSEIIGTTAASVNLKMANFQAIDPEKSGGLDRWSRQSKEVWDELAYDERRLRIASDKCRRNAADLPVSYQDFPPNTLDQITSILQSDPNLSPNNVKTLSEIIKTYYQRLASR